GGWGAWRRRRLSRGRGFEIGRDRAHAFGPVALAGRDVIPESIAAEREDQSREQHAPARNAPLRQRNGKAQAALRLETDGFLLEAAHRLVAIEAEMRRIGTHEADRIDLGRQPVVMAFLDR